MLKELLDRCGVLYLDGGTSTELENKGYDIADPLWSAKLLIDQPAAVEQVHLEYLASGADFCTSISYQATVEGFTKRGYTPKEAGAFIQSSVRLAARARDAFWQEQSNRTGGRPRPIVAASVGAYGAYLADGSEYRGNYGLSRDALRAFHRERLELLVEAGAELIACETLPCLEEAVVLAELVGAHQGLGCWVSFSCRDNGHISDGTPIEVCARALDAYGQVEALGVNCIPPQIGSALIERIGAVTQKPVIIYPNSGEEYDAVAKVWRGAADGIAFEDRALAWYRAGARLIGGCCRTTPEDIRRVAAKLAFAREQR